MPIICIGLCSWFPLAQVARLLHEQLPLKKLCVGKVSGKRDQQKGNVNATSFETRINNWMVNNISRAPEGGFTLQLPHDLPMTSPLRCLVDAKIAMVMPEGAQAIQGHSGKSIIGRGSKPNRPTSPLQCGINKKKSTERVEQQSDEEDSGSFHSCSFNFDLHQ